MRIKIFPPIKSDKSVFSVVLYEIHNGAELNYEDWKYSEYRDIKTDMFCSYEEALLAADEMLMEKENA